MFNNQVRLVTELHGMPGKCRFDHPTVVQDSAPPRQALLQFETVRGQLSIVTPLSGAQRASCQCQDRYWPETHRGGEFDGPVELALGEIGLSRQKEKHAMIVEAVDAEGPLWKAIVDGCRTEHLRHCLGEVPQSQFARLLDDLGIEPQDQRVRDLVARMKLIPIREIISGQRIVLCEDSIVRGTQLKNYTIKKLMENGAKEIHVRPACPPLMFPCKFALSTRSTSELAARRAIRSIEGKDIDDVSEYLDPQTSKYEKMVNWIQREIGSTTLQYQTIENMIQAIGLPREKLCLHCWAGEMGTRQA